ncbi:hypothetical protein CK203_098298 [Vitis vinifera]|uniref:PROP1-like PPR domain-containing protein n=2 Tax=Vitis vinifera TaxID=29760 RepID=A0A438E4P2_VITVI|nr:hypothetical protein CK203_098298 [Vitis vinifera]
MSYRKKEGCKVDSLRSKLVWEEGLRETSRGSHLMFYSLCLLGSGSVTPIDEMYTCVILAAILAIGFATNAFGIQVLCNWFFHGWTGDLELPQDQWALRVAHYTPWLTYWWNTQKWFPACSVAEHTTNIISHQDKKLMLKLSKRMEYMAHVRQQEEFESTHRDLMIGFRTWEFDPMDLKNPFPNNEVFISKYHDDLVMRTVEGKLCEEHLVTREKYSKKRLDSRKNEGMSPKFPSLKLESKNLVDESLKANENEEKNPRKTCAKKNGDVMGALDLYDLAIRKGIELGQYHYIVLLYLCSLAALGVIRLAKSGIGSRSLDMLSPSSEVCGGVSEDLVEFGDTSKKNSEAFEVEKDDLDGSFIKMDKLS